MNNGYMIIDKKLIVSTDNEMKIKEDTNANIEKLLEKENVIEEIDEKISELHEAIIDLHEDEKVSKRLSKITAVTPVAITGAYFGITNLALADSDVLINIFGSSEPINLAGGAIAAVVFAICTPHFVANMREAIGTRRQINGCKNVVEYLNGEKTKISEELATLSDKPFTNIPVESEMFIKIDTDEEMKKLEKNCKKAYVKGYKKRSK